MVAQGRTFRAFLLSTLCVFAKCHFAKSGPNMEGVYLSGTDPQGPKRLLWVSSTLGQEGLLLYAL